MLRRHFQSVDVRQSDDHGDVDSTAPQYVGHGHRIECHGDRL